MGKILTKRGPRKVIYANSENILGNHCSKELQGICDGINHPYKVINSDGKRISKTFAEIAVCIKKDITNKLRHRKCVRLEMSINTYLEDLGEEIIQKANMITIFRT